MYSLSDVQHYIHTKSHVLSGACVWQYVQPKPVRNIYSWMAVGTTWRLQPDLQTQRYRGWAPMQRTKTHTSMQICNNQTWRVVLQFLSDGLHSTTTSTSKYVHYLQSIIIYIPIGDKTGSLYGTECATLHGFPLKWMCRLQLILRCGLQHQVCIQSNGLTLSDYLFFRQQTRKSPTKRQLDTLKHTKKHQLSQLMPGQSSFGCGALETVYVSLHLRATFSKVTVLCEFLIFSFFVRVQTINK